MGMFEVILAFMEKGGNVLWLIAALVFFMWTLIFERVWYFTSVWKADRAAVVSAWEGRSEFKSWNAKKVRERLLSESRELINDNMNVIATCVALCPLLGLLGTVTGMIEVFNVMAVTGGGDAKSMAGGVERSTIPHHGGHGRSVIGPVREYLSSKDYQPGAAAPDRSIDVGSLILSLG
ncbi:MAG: TonB2 energy transduction system inner membrane component ExbB [Gammaproteobacteria bacterium]|nr:MAG: TonB2 energy transduction system inner membrane component ExbB [Gammaproteobacteria bacterium]